MTRVKICGLMNQQDIDLCVQAGVHMLGFVVDYPLSVPWNLTIERAEELIHYVPPFVSTCVVTGGSVEKVLDVAEQTCPHVVQLHYEEKLDEIKKIAYQLQLKGIKTVKALRVDKHGKCAFEITEPILAARELSNSGISAILVDSYTESMPGGTGVTVDVTTFRMIQKESSVPVILAGGLNPINVQSLINDLHPYAVDVLTGVEVEPRQKDAKKVVEFMRNAHFSKERGTCGTNPSSDARLSKV